MPDGRTSCLEFIEDGVRIGYADPNPGPCVALITFTEEKCTLLARYGSKGAGHLPVNFKAEHIGIVSQASFQAADRKNGESVIDVRRHFPLRLSGNGPWNATSVVMPKHDHHKAAEHHEEAAKSHKKAAELHDEGDHEQATQHSQLANDHSKKAQEASASAHAKTKGPKTL